MKRRNGKYYRKFKSSMGRTYWIEMDRAEVLQAEVYRATVILTPIFMLLAFAWAAGLLK